MLIVAPVMTNLNASGGGDDYSKLPEGQSRRHGPVLLWTSNLGGGRLDAFIVRVPAQLRAAARRLPDTESPAVAITAPVSGVLVSGPTTVSATASDNVGVAGVQFKIDGANLGAERTAAPYSISWTPPITADSSFTFTAVARDAAGNTDTSNPVFVNVDTVAPGISSVAGVGCVLDRGDHWAGARTKPRIRRRSMARRLGYGSVTTLNPAMVMPHTSGVSGLTAGTLYHYRVKSRDAAGNLAVSGDFTFTTTTAPPPPPPPPPGSLVAHWALDEGSGTIAADASGSGNTGTLVNGPVWTAGPGSPAVAFDGIDDHVAAPHATRAQRVPLTVTAWIKTSSTTGVVGIVNKYAAGSFDGYNVFMNGGALCAWYIRSASNLVYDGGGCTLSTTGYNDNQWHQVVYVVDASGAQLYVDGAPKASRAWTGSAGAPTTTQPVHVGHYPGAFGGAEYFPGAIDDVRIYGRALTCFGDRDSVQSRSRERPRGALASRRRQRHDRGRCVRPRLRRHAGERAGLDGRAVSPARSP